MQGEKSFYDEIKSIFHYFLRAIIEANKKILKYQSSTFNILIQKHLTVCNIFKQLKKN